MTEALANLTQVLNQSPQVGALAGGHLAAVEAARREAQIETSQRWREALAQTVLPAAENGETAPVDPESRSANHRLSRPGVPRPRPNLKADGGRPGPEAAPSPFDPLPVVDIRV